MIKISCDICGGAIKNEMERMDAVFHVPCINHEADRYNLCQKCAMNLRLAIRKEKEKHDRS